MQGSRSCVQYAYAMPTTFTPKSNKSRILMNITNSETPESSGKLWVGYDGTPLYPKWYQIAAKWVERFEKHNRFSVGQKVLYGLVDLVEVEIIDKKIEPFPDTQGYFPDRKTVRYSLKCCECIKGDSGMNMTEV